MFRLMFPKPPKQVKKPKRRYGRTREPIAFPGGLAEEVTYRDWTEMFKLAVARGEKVGLLNLTWPRSKACVAPGLDWSGSGPCSGRITMQHVKISPGMSVPRVHRAEMLVSLCENHHLLTAAGANWATRTLDLQRDYLARLYPRFWKEAREQSQPRLLGGD